ncbi:hypothetical protein BH11GEM2_BH11GEM2_30640 [soil metagenome]
MVFLYLFVIPAKAGSHFWAWCNMDSRIRGNDERTFKSHAPDHNPNPSCGSATRLTPTRLFCDA